MRGRSSPRSSSIAVVFWLGGVCPIYDIAADRSGGVVDGDDGGEMRGTARSMIDGGDDDDEETRIRSIRDREMTASTRKRT